ncbi:alpha-ribazole phosphatase [Mangrovibacterium marinum]|uniref:Alpha-ribazole phosphatase n=1 Tax=Mangrovibacterium marinum TaxID=1639118 RepID=A0A2T5BXB6_9BACT|nr:alpha-ribazole phosphatase [Mangrovibacterium marinum]PTN04802.1 alpha-ribazole phosphatase [Mangrovibacterium marinum]
MIITTIRHTRVDVPAGVCYGQTDVPLASTYTEEMAAVKTQTDWYQFDAVYCSSLSRCRRLAEDLFPRETILFDERLMELNFGRWEMQKWDDMDHTAEAQAWFADFVDVRTPQGECFRDQINRTADFLKDLKLTGYKRVAVVTHGGIIRALHCLLNGTKPEDAFQNKVNYGEVVEFET